MIYNCLRMNIYIFRKLSHTSHRGRTETSLDTFGHLLPAPSTQQQGLLARKYLCQLGQTNLVGIGGKVYRFLGIHLSWYHQHRSNKSSGAFMKSVQVTVCWCKLWRWQLKGKMWRWKLKRGWIRCLLEVWSVDSFSTVNSCSKAQKEQILTYYYALRMLS